MSTDHRYNGWANYETWCVKLWMDNDECEYRYWKREAKVAKDVEDLALLLKTNHESEAFSYLPGSSWMSDLLTAAIGEVDWYEIAESLLEEVKE